MQRTVDVYVTEDELRDGAKGKKTACTKVDRTLLQPALCVSKQGASTAMIFPSPRDEGNGYPQPSNRQMNALFQTFFGPDSLTGAVLQYQQQQKHQQQQRAEAHAQEVAEHEEPAARSQAAPVHHMHGGPPQPSVVAPPRSKPIRNTAASMSLLMARSQAKSAASELERLIQHQGEQLVSLKHVAPHIARKYGITHNPQPPRPASAQPASQVAGAHAAAQAQRKKTSAAGLLAAAAAAEEEQRARLAERRQQQADASTSGGAPQQGADEGTAAMDTRRPRPASAAFRSTTRNQASRTGSRFVYVGNDTPAPGKYNPKYNHIDKAEKTPVDMQRMTVAGLRPNKGSGPGRPTSAPAGGRPKPSGENGATYRPESAVAHTNGAPVGAAQPANAGADTDGKEGAAWQEGAAAPPTVAGGLFDGAHRVHARKPPAVGSVPFKAPGRPFTAHVSTASDLFNAYYKAGYDEMTRRRTRPASAFTNQTVRPPPNTGTDPALELAPGMYMQHELPATRTGRHVKAGHSKLAQTRDWTRATARPGSAPPGAQRPPNINAQKHGYWGPDGPTTTLWPNEPQYSELVSIRALQERVQQSHPLRQAGYNPGHALRGGPNSAAAVEQVVGDAAPAAVAEPEVPLTYVEPKDYAKFGSTGFAKRVPGGAFSETTRERHAQTIRAMADGKVIPPAAVAVLTAADLTYDPNWLQEGHRSRTPMCHMPPNRAALSQKWVTSAATAYL